MGATEHDNCNVANIHTHAAASVVESARKLVRCLCSILWSKKHTTHRTNIRGYLIFYKICCVVFVCFFFFVEIIVSLTSSSTKRRILKIEKIKNKNTSAQKRHIHITRKSRLKKVEFVIKISTILLMLFCWLFAIRNQWKMKLENELTNKKHTHINHEETRNKIVCDCASETMLKATKQKVFSISLHLRICKLRIFILEMAVCWCAKNSDPALFVSNQWIIYDWRPNSEMHIISPPA